MFEAAAYLNRKTYGRTFASVLLGAVLALSASAGCCFGQAPPADIYANFVGEWIGYDDTILNGSLRHISVDLVITESKRRDSVAMAYTYAKRGDQDYSSVTKTMELLPLKSEMILSVEGDNNKYKTDGLDKFAVTGLGQFTATGDAVGPIGGSGRGRFALSLAPDSLSYSWSNQISNGSFATVSRFTFKRATTTSSHP